MSYLRPAIIGLLALAALLLFSGGQRAHAAFISVSTTADDFGAFAICSLREGDPGGQHGCRFWQLRGRHRLQVSFA